jgi:hypothetical protein
MSKQLSFDKNLLTQHSYTVKSEFDKLEGLEPFNFIQSLVKGKSANMMLALAESILRQANYDQFKKYNSPLERDVTSLIVKSKAIREENKALIAERMAKREAQSDTTEQVVIEVNDEGKQIGARVDVIADRGRPEIQYAKESTSADGGAVA